MSATNVSCPPLTRCGATQLSHKRRRQLADEEQHACLEISNSRLISKLSKPIQSQTDKLLLETLSVPKIDCRLRAAVVIEPVSADSLRKMGISADTAGDFRRFPPQVRQAGAQRRKRMRRKPGFPAHSDVSSETWLYPGMGGWGGRDRTSEWRNQNPLPYRLATPQQSGPEHGIDQRDLFRHRRSIEGATLFQQAAGPNFTPKSGPVDLPLYKGSLLWVRRAGFPAPGRGEYRPAES